MSGHSHWATIKHKKASKDAKRGKEWSKVLKVVMASAREGGGDPKINAKLAQALEKAKAVHVPKDTIDRVIQRATGQLDGFVIENVTYEGYGPGGTAVMIETLTDNKNRTNPELKKIFEKHGGNLGAAGCVSWQFVKRGVIVFSAPGKTEDEAMEIALDAGADDISGREGTYEVVCETSDFENVRKAIEAKEGVKIESAELALNPTSYVDLNAHDGRKILGLMEDLEDHDDVQSVASNFNLPPELVAEYEAQG
ncbi:MAG TPA: YebC/PmpR family DNA-binding transcriptional regulator [Candidatus Brocadiia bacterium]|nr:YebC/PmpR family DNA-binding transcriptional regulator [Candidatus Brocadiia bacterium]